MFWIKCLLFVAALHFTENKKLGLPCAPESDGQCQDAATYLNKKLNLCCSLCEPGFHQTSVCTATSDTVCEMCIDGYYFEKWNHFSNCFRCLTCREESGLEYAQHCNVSSNTKCACKEGTYCLYGRLPQCWECKEFTTCDKGYGVSRPGTAELDVRCSPCSEGTFSDKVSYTETCQQHTDCESQGRNTLYPGSDTTDARCGSVVRPSFTGAPASTANAPLNAKTQTMASIFTTSSQHKDAPRLRSKTPDSLDSFGVLTVVIITVIVAVVAIVIVVVTLSRKRKGDTNNNINEEAIKPLRGTSGVGLRISPTACPTEQKCLLGGQDSSNPSLSSSSSSSSTTEHRVPVAPESTIHSSHAPVHHSSQEGNACRNNPQTSSSTVTVNISTTINCHHPTCTYECTVPTSPATDSTPHDRDLPLSKEEEHLDLSLPQHCEAKDARTAVQENGKVVC